MIPPSQKVGKKTEKPLDQRLILPSTRLRQRGEARCFLAALAGFRSLTWCSRRRTG
jgi:hypothetical protein